MEIIKHKIGNDCASIVKEFLMPSEKDVQLIKWKSLQELILNKWFRDSKMLYESSCLRSFRECVAQDRELIYELAGLTSIVSGYRIREDEQVEHGVNSIFDSDDYYSLNTTKKNYQAKYFPSSKKSKSAFYKFKRKVDKYVLLILFQKEKIPRSRA